MSINQTIKVDDARGQVLVDERNRSVGKKEEEDIPAIDKSHKSVDANVEHEESGDYKGRKYAPEIDGPQQASQETDEIYKDSRSNSGLPPAGKNVGELDADHLGKDDLGKDDI